MSRAKLLEIVNLLFKVCNRFLVVYFEECSEISRKQDISLSQVYTGLSFIIVLKNEKPLRATVADNVSPHRHCHSHTVTAQLSHGAAAHNKQAGLPDTTSSRGAPLPHPNARSKNSPQLQLSATVQRLRCDGAQR